MLTFSERAIGALNTFGRRQTGGDVLRIAVEKDGCGSEMGFFLYVSDWLPNDHVYPFSDCLVTVDPTSGRFLQNTMVDIEPDGGLELIATRRQKTGGCSSGG